MKLEKNIFLISFATLLLLVSIILPHHHHGDSACFAFEKCQDLDHKDHHHNTKDDTNCVLKKEFLTSQSNHDQVLKLADWQLPSQLNFFLFYCLHDYFNYRILELSNGYPNFRAYQYPIHYRLYSLSSGLRSPPFYA